MKLTAIIFLSACIAASASGNAQRISITVKGASLEKVFQEIKKQTGYTFVYRDEWLQEAKKVDLNLKDVSLDEVLNACFKNQPLTYSIVKTTVVIQQKKQSPNENPDSYRNNQRNEPPPPIDITGKVTDADGNPLAGANVKVKGTNNGTTTNNDGVFVLKGVDDNASLEISFVGFETLNIPVNGRTAIVTTLKTQVKDMKEVVVNKGYYTETMRNTVGNVSHVGKEDIEKQPVQNPLVALQGRVTGIEITQLTGLPGGNTTVRIQGRNSFRDIALEPLVIVDGVPYPTQFLNTNMESVLQGGSPLNYINPSDIESIDILKDADATAIYGSRAGNGAIIITTKKGKAGSTKLSVNLQQGWGKITRQANMMNTRQYLDMRYEAFKNDGYTPSSDPNDYPNYAPDLTLWDTTRYTDWQKVFIGGTAKYSNINASFSGGTTNVQYLIGGTYRRQTSVFPGNYDDKVGSMNFNISGFSANQKLHVQLSGNYMYDENKLPNVDLTNTAVLMEPDAPPLYNPDGTLNWAPNLAGLSSWTNPLAIIFENDFDNTTKNLIGSININYKILPRLTIGGSAGYTNMQSSLFASSRIEGQRPEDRATAVRLARFANRNMSNWIIEPQVRYASKLGKGNLDGLLGSTFSKNSVDLLVARGEGYASDQLMNALASAPSRFIDGSSYSVYKYNAVFGRINYDWKQKYILNLTGRRDGSSRFGENNKFHNFWSVGAGWIFTDEKLVQQHVRFLSFGKLRASYGTTGNDQVGDYSYISTYFSTSNSIPYQGVSNLIISKIPNPNLQWEETQKWQGGIDLGLWRDRIIFGATYARNKSSNQLILYALPNITGFSSINENFPATIRNTSLEFTLHTVNVERKNFTWTSDINLTIPRNKLISFPNIEKTSYASGENGIIIGQPVGVVKTFRYDGVDPATGDYHVFDNNGNSVYFPTNYSASKLSLANAITKFYGGWINAIGYKRFQLDFVFQFVYKNGNKDLYYYNGIAYPGVFIDAGLSNQPVSVINHWKKVGDVAPVARYSMDAGNTYVIIPNTDAKYSYDASFIRLKNVSLSWQLPNIWMQKAKMQGAILYFRGENLATITKYKGLDPESQSIGSLPPLQVWTVGIKLDF